MPEKTPAQYEIRIEGHLGDMWMAWFEGMQIRLEAGEDGGKPVTVLSGPVPDQPALHGLLASIRDLNLTLLSVKKILPDQSNK